MDTKGIFISYRRDESAGYAGRLADRLNEHFGEHHVFRDIDSIEPGLDFVEAIQRAVDSSEVLIVVIGRNWTRATDAAGRERLQDPHDHLRMEIATALKRNIRVIPVLVQGASMPSTDELPDDLAPLTRRNALELHESSWGDDVRRFITVLERVVGRKEEREGPAEQRSHEEESLPPQGQDLIASTPRVELQRGYRSAPRPRWGQIGVAVLLAGMITVVPQLLWYLVTGMVIPKPFLWGILHPIVLFCGLWAGFAWPGRHLKGYVLLGSVAALLDLAINWEFGNLFTFWLPVNPGDLLSDMGIVALFTAGGCFGDLIERWRPPRARGGE